MNFDAKTHGNEARFANHSCDPNMKTVQVHVESEDYIMPKMCFFSNRDIRGIKNTLK